MYSNLNDNQFDSMADTANEASGESSSNQQQPVDGGSPPQSMEEEADNASLNTLARTVQSYLYATAAVRNMSVAQAATDSGSASPPPAGKLKRGLECALLDAQHDMVRRFEAKNAVLEELLNKFENCNIAHTKYKFSRQEPGDKMNRTVQGLTRLLHLFANCESYFSLMLSPVADNFYMETSLSRHRQVRQAIKQVSEASRQSTPQFHICPLCSHCLLEPITLTCGCSYCKSCLNEYNLIGQAVGASGLTIQCYSCGKPHPKNPADCLKVNTLIALIVEKLWSVNVEIKKLRNDIRNYVIYDFESNRTFDLHKYEFLFEQAYEKGKHPKHLTIIDLNPPTSIFDLIFLDKSNHLLLADLFLINYFSENYERSLRFAQQLVQLKPDWIMVN